MEPKTPPEAPGIPQTTPGAKVTQKVAGQTWDYREAFWASFDRACHIKAYPATGDLTGAVESAYLYARMGSDAEFDKEWRKRTLHRIPGTEIAVPTPQDNQRALEIMADLARRKGWAEKRRGISALKPWTLPGERNLKDGLREPPVPLTSGNGHSGGSSSPS